MIFISIIHVQVESQPKLSVQLGAFKSHPAGAPTSQATQDQELEQTGLNIFFIFFIAYLKARSITH